MKIDSMSKAKAKKKGQMHMAISVILIVDLKSFIMGCIADTICPPLKLKDKKTD